MTVTDLISKACAWINGMRKQSAAATAAYSRSAATAPIHATLGSTEHSMMDESGATVTAQSADFIVSADELVLDGVRILPRSGDRIRIVQNGQALVYEVAPLGGVCFRPSGPCGLAYRIHAKLVETSLTAGEVET